MLKNVHKNPSARPLCARNSTLVSPAVQFGKRLAHYTEVCLTVQFENLRVALPQHLRHHVIGDAAQTLKAGTFVAL